jgi:DNA-binding CsgD family transcriptional regulator
MRTARSPSWPDRETSRFLDAIECIYAHDGFATFYLRAFEAISGLVDDVVLSMDRTSLRDGKAESRNTKEGIISQEMQSLILLLLPENPAAPALRSGARGVLSPTDFVTRREFERTALYNEILRPIDVRYQLLVPLEVPGYVTAVSINRRSDFSRGEIRKLRLFSAHLVRAYLNAQTITRLGAFASEVPHPELLHHLDLTPQESHIMHWLIQGKRDGEIATILNSKTRTVQKHTQHIFTKLGVETRTAAALVALERTARCQLGKGAGRRQGLESKPPWISSSDAISQPNP